MQNRRSSTQPFSPPPLLFMLLYRLDGVSVSRQPQPYVDAAAPDDPPAGADVPSVCPLCRGVPSAGWCPSKLEVCLYVSFPPYRKAGNRCRRAPLSRHKFNIAGENEVRPQCVKGQVIPAAIDLKNKKPNSIYSPVSNILFIRMTIQIVHRIFFF